MKSDMNTNVLKGRRMNLADYLYQRWGAEVPAGTTLEDVLHPAFFRNFTAQLKPGARIEVLSDCMTLDVELRVTTVTNTTVETRILRDNSVEAPAVVPPADELSVGWGGPKHKWRIMRAGQVVDKGFGTPEDAAEAMESMS